MTYAYIRVSSNSQNVDRQLLEIEKYNLPKENIFIDYQSGKNFERKNYKKLKSILQKGDLIIIKSIDRLGRDYKMITDEWRELTKMLEVHINVIDMPLLNTNAYPESLMGTFISDLVLQVLSFVAQNELDYIKQRQKEGIEAAKLKGKHLGRPFCEIPDNFENIVLKYATKEITLIDALDESRLSRSSFYKYSKELQKRKKL